MTTRFGSSTSPAAGPSGLVGPRYLLAVILLVSLSSLPVLAAVIAGVATLTRPPLTPPVDSSPFVTYRPGRCPTHCPTTRPGRSVRCEQYLCPAAGDSARCPAAGCPTGGPAPRRSGPLPHPAPTTRPDTWDRPVVITHERTGDAERHPP